MKCLAQPALACQNGEQRGDVLPADTRARVVRQAEYRGSRIARPVVLAAGRAHAADNRHSSAGPFFYAWWLIRASGISQQTVMGDFLVTHPER